MDPRARSLPFLVGPTAVGKTDVAVHLALRWDAVILSIDARQVYRGLDIGTGTPPDPRERRLHRLLDLWDPRESGSAARYAASFWSEAERAWKQGGRVLAAGGSGLYVDAVLGRVDPMPPPDRRIRERLQSRWKVEGGEKLHAELAGVDPAAARRLAPADAQRILRALEVWEATGRPLSSWQRSGHGPLDVSDGPPMVLLLRGRDDLSRRIAIRCEAMISGGLESEIRGLLGAGLTPDAPAFKTLGYAEWLPAVLGERSRDDAMDLFVRNTRRYARRQTTWFRNRYRGQRVLTVAPSEDPAESSGRVGEDLGADWGRGGA